LRDKIIILLISYCSTVGIFAQQSSLITKIPFELEGEHIFIKVNVNNSEKLDFVFDTGASSLTINSRTVTQLNSSNEKQIKRKAKIKINNLVLNNNVIIHSLLHLEKAVGRDIDGIIGYDLLKKYVIKINYDNLEIEIYRAKRFKYTGNGKTIKIKKGGSGKHCSINSQITLSNGQTIEGEFILDSGAGLALTLLNPFSEKHSIIKTFDKYYEIRTYGYYNVKYTSTTGRINQVNISDFEFDNVPIKLGVVNVGYFANNEEITGLIGNMILKRFNITFDYKGKKSYWELNNRFENEQFKVSSSGIRLSLDSTKTKKIIKDIDLKYVPTDLGLEVGDEIIEIDGMLAINTPLWKLKELLMQDGKVVEIKCKRKNSFIEVKLKLKALI
jgi:predicted aspartyl protease